MIPFTDPIALRDGLERQLRIVAPIAVRLRAAAQAAGMIPADEWRGPAAERFRAREVELRALLLASASATEGVVHRIRVALANLP